MVAGKEGVRPGVGSRYIFTAALLKASCFLQHWVCSPWIRPFVDGGTSLKYPRLRRGVCVWIQVYVSAHVTSVIVTNILSFVVILHYLSPATSFFLKRFCCEPLMSVGSATATMKCRGVGREAMTLQKHRVTSNHRNQAVKMMSISSVIHGSDSLV